MKCWKFGASRVVTLVFAVAAVWGWALYLRADGRCDCNCSPLPARQIGKRDDQVFKPWFPEFVPKAPLDVVVWEGFDGSLLYSDERLYKVRPHPFLPLLTAQGHETVWKPWTRNQRHREGCSCAAPGHTRRATSTPPCVGRHGVRPREHVQIHFGLSVHLQGHIWEIRAGIPRARNKRPTCAGGCRTSTDGRADTSRSCSHQRAIGVVGKVRGAPEDSHCEDAIACIAVHQTCGRRVCGPKSGFCLRML